MVFPAAGDTEAAGYPVTSASAPHPERRLGPSAKDSSEPSPASPPDHPIGRAAQKVQPPGNTHSSVAVIVM